MTESAQHHLLTATLLNLRLTRELHQKMEEKDQQIVDLQKQVKEQGNNIDAKIQQLDAKVDTKFHDLQTIVHDLDVKAEQQTRNLDTKVSDLQTTMEANTVKIQNDLLLLNGFFPTSLLSLSLRNNKQKTAMDTGVVEGLLHKGGASHSMCIRMVFYLLMEHICQSAFINSMMLTKQKV